MDAAKNGIKEAINMDCTHILWYFSGPSVIGNGNLISRMPKDNHYDNEAYEITLEEILWLVSETGFT